MPDNTELTEVLLKLTDLSAVVTRLACDTADIKRLLEAQNSRLRDLEIHGAEERG